MIYVPDDNSFSACYVVNSSDTIRAYQNVPSQNSTINYRDYYFNGHYIFKDGVQTFSQYTTLPICLPNNKISHDVWYRNDLDSILLIFLILVIFIFFLPYKIISRILGKWGRI